jgi:hypothetical protein
MLMFSTRLFSTKCVRMKAGCCNIGSSTTTVSSLVVAYNSNQSSICYKERRSFIVLVIGYFQAVGMLASVYPRPERNFPTGTSTQFGLSRSKVIQMRLNWEDDRGKTKTSFYRRTRRSVHSKSKYCGVGKRPSLAAKLQSSNRRKHVVAMLLIVAVVVPTVLLLPKSSYPHQKCFKTTDDLQRTVNQWLHGEVILRAAWRRRIGCTDFSNVQFTDRYLVYRFSNLYLEP